MASAVVSVVTAGAVMVFFLLLVEDRQILGIFQHEARGLPQGVGGLQFLTEHNMTYIVKTKNTYKTIT